MIGQFPNNPDSGSSQGLITLLAIPGGDHRLIEAHRAAVAEALKETETYVASRVRQGGANEDRSTSNLVLAVYHHDTSRDLDPQLHTHAVAANLTFDGTEGRWRRCKHRTSMNAGLISRKSTAMRWRVRLERSATKSRISGTHGPRCRLRDPRRRGRTARKVQSAQAAANGQ